MHPAIRPKPQNPFHGPVKRSAKSPTFLLLAGYGMKMLNLSKNCKLEPPLQLPQFTMAAIKEITKIKKSLTQSPEKNVHTNTLQDATTPLHPVLPVDTVEIPTAQTVVY